MNGFAVIRPGSVGAYGTACAFVYRDCVFVIIDDYRMRADGSAAVDDRFLIVAEFSVLGFLNGQCVTENDRSICINSFFTAVGSDLCCAVIDRQSALAVDTV